MKAAIYLRVSKDDGTQDTENQLHGCMEMATQRGWEVPPDYVFREEISGATLRGERPVLDAVAEMASRGKFGVLVVWKLDRFSRDDSYLGGLMMLGEFAEQYKVPVLSYSETYLDMTGPFAKPLQTLALTLAAEFRRAVVAHTQKAIDRRQRELQSAGRFLVTGRSAKRKGQFIERLGRPAALSKEQQAQARALWQQGEGGYLIAKKLGLKESTVRTYCRRWDREKGSQEGGGESGEKP